jgi:hypothetical protein
MGGSLKAEGFGDGQGVRSHPQATLEAATLQDFYIKFDSLIGSGYIRAVKGIFL